MRDFRLELPVFTKDGQYIGNMIIYPDSDENKVNYKMDPVVDIRSVNQHKAVMNLIDRVEKNRNDLIKILNQLNPDIDKGQP